MPAKVPLDKSWFLRLEGLHANLRASQNDGDMIFDDFILMQALFLFWILDAFRPRFCYIYIIDDACALTAYHNAATFTKMAYALHASFPFHLICYIIDLILEESPQFII